MLWRDLLRLLLGRNLLLLRVMVTLNLALSLLLSSLLTSLLVLYPPGLHHQVCIWHLHSLSCLQYSQLLGLRHAVHADRNLRNQTSCGHLCSERRLLLLHWQSRPGLTWSLDLSGQAGCQWVRHANMACRPILDNLGSSRCRWYAAHLIRGSILQSSLGSKPVSMTECQARHLDETYLALCFLLLGETQQLLLHLLLALVSQATVIFWCLGG